MTILLVAAAVIAGAGAIAALAPLDLRVGLIGLTACLVGAALLSDPLPQPAVLAVRLTGALLVVVVLRASSGLGDAGGTGGIRDGRGWSGHAGASDIGWPASALLGIAGAVAGLAIAGALGATVPGSGDVGQPATLAPADLLGAGSLALGLAGLIVAIALGPLLVDPTGPRRSVAAVLVVAAVVLARTGLVGAASALEEIVFAALLVSVAVAGSVLAAATRAARPAGGAGIGGPPATARTAVAAGDAPERRHRAASRPS